jgi:hypothetical protein
LGESVDAPWGLTEEGLLLWFEGELIGTNVENLLQSGVSLENGLLFANGAIQVYNLHGMLVAQGNNSISTSHLQAGVYIIAVSNAEGNMVQKMLLQ